MFNTPINRCHFAVFTFMLTSFAISIQPANAGLVFRELNITLDASMVSSYDLDVDLDGTVDYTFSSALIPDPILPLGFNTVDFPFGSNSGVVIDTPTGDGFPTVSRLSIGDVVSSSSIFSFPATDQGNLSSFIGTDPTSGNFEGRTGYLGLRFDRMGGTAFGFAEISVNASSAGVNPFGLTLRSVAFNDTLGEFATITAVPEPSSLMLAGLSFGLLAVIRCRQKRRNPPKTGIE